MQSDTPMPPPLPPPSLFIASLGNPGAGYALTRHSAGHVVLTALAEHLDSSTAFSEGRDGVPTASGLITLPPPKAAKAKKRKRVLTPQPGSSPAPPEQQAVSTESQSGDGLKPEPQNDGQSERHSPPPRSPSPPPPPPVAHWTLWQSPAWMNESGPALRQAWRYHGATARLPDSGVPVPASGTRLVVLHDSLEHDAGVVAVRPNAGQLSAKGHNGIKSVIEAFDSQASRAARKARRSGGGGAQASADGEVEQRWTKISIGIGRPDGRHPDEVSRFVLAKLGEKELGKLRGKTTLAVLEALKGIK